MKNSNNEQLNISKLKLLETHDYVAPHLVNAYIDDRAKRKRLINYCSSHHIPTIIHHKKECYKELVKHILSTTPVDITDLIKSEISPELIDNLTLDQYIDLALDPNCTKVYLKEFAFNEHFAVSSFTPNRLSVFNARFRVHDDIVDWRQKH